MISAAVFYSKIASSTHRVSLYNYLIIRLHSEQYCDYMHQVTLPLTYISKHTLLVQCHKQLYKHKLLLVTVRATKSLKSPDCHCVHHWLIRSTYSQCFPGILTSLIKTALATHGYSKLKLICLLSVKLSQLWQLPTWWYRLSYRTFDYRQNCIPN